MNETTINLVGSNGDLVKMQVNELGQVVPFTNTTEPTQIQLAPRGELRVVGGAVTITKDDVVFILSIFNAVLLLYLAAKVK